MVWIHIIMIKYTLTSKEDINYDIQKMDYDITDI